SEGGGDVLPASGDPGGGGLIALRAPEPPRDALAHRPCRVEVDHHFAWSSVLVEVGPIRHARFAGAARDPRLVRHEQFGAAALVQRAGGAGGVLFDRAQSPAEPSYVFAKTLLELVPPCGDTRCFLGREGAEQQVA